MDLIQAALLGIIQGITEWLPISSTGHLRVVPALMGWPDPGAGFTAVIQLGTILAVVMYFRTELSRAFMAWCRSLFGKERDSVDARIGWGVFWGTIPILIVGYLGRDYIEGPLRSLEVVAWALILFGIVMAVADRYWVGKKDMKQSRVIDGVIVGLFQCLSLIPGVSRSGATMTGAYLSGFNRADAARFSFLLSIPSITAAGLYQLYNQRDHILREQLAPVLVATVVSFVVGYATIAWLIKYLQRRGLGVFVLYRLALGVILLVLIHNGTLPRFDEPAPPVIAATEVTQR